MDLATKHQPVGDLFHEQHAAQDKGAFHLSPEQVAQYEEKGYVAGTRILTEVQCDALCEELAALTNPKHPGNHLFYEFNSNESTDPSTVLFHALGAWRVSPGFHDILWNPAFTTAAGDLLGGAVRFWHDQLFCKPAKHGGVVAWHQDYSYWTRTLPMQHLTCWIGLDDADEENGCLYYVPGSHTWPLLPATGLAGDMEAIQSVLNDEQKAAFKPIPIRLKRGECAFHHPLLVHGSYDNKSERPRRAVVLNVVRDGVHSDSDEALLAGVPPVPKGSPLGGDFFPLLYPASE
ncbi:MAG: phytanoyl-CoA dioxygenase family protein [Candidatus Hydrogenedentes bacterium]|nr:phytanoyl-CoA dioxygenase family protein [Candidatus Hydrogenedentota bacterium]